MKTIIFLALSIIGLNINSVAQTQYPKGCYMSLAEIQSKNPSVNLNLEIKERTTGDIRMNGGNDYKLISPDKSVKKKTLKKVIWAYSDGEHLYINCFLHKCQLWYAQVELEGDKLIFNAGVSNGQATTAALMGGAIGAAAIATKRYPYSLDLESGQVKRLDKN